MAGEPDPERHARGWSAVGGVVTIVMAGAAYVSPLWPLFAVLAGVGFYFALAPLLRWPPWQSLSDEAAWFRNRIRAA